MIVIKREVIKALIELSTSYEDANKIIEEHTGYKTYSEKIAYLKGMFDCEIFSRAVESEEADYVALLTSVIEEKWH